MYAALFVLVPGRAAYGPRTPGGQRHRYKLNGLSAWMLTLVLAMYAVYLKIISPSCIAEHWDSFIVAASSWCFLLVGVFQVKAHFFPDTAGDTLVTGYFFFDVFNGGELHPRWPGSFDWKHFNASRSGGLLLWTLIDLSFAAHQYERHGMITNSMVLTVAYRAIIVAEYFYFEHWFFETLDSTNERFSFYSIYGFAAVMPHIWTLQSQYLAQNPKVLSPTGLCLSIGLFAMGWALNHLTNRQKVRVKKTLGECTIWGRTPKLLRATYKTSDGKIHQTKLLCSGE
ncbi:hypothetical protein NLG97_g3973 [Lecanicillium saksenae]|uniref:Uncharacterized protein n=1 Tax=Lecanicillium saksenae TaxID=468837 RepID=A0ACC1QWL5_9HYPO|nr:hypothetical protein NLG97_g3973 [Lecanicillium saksenae]